MQLEHIEQIDDRLEIIKQTINLEDAYYVNNAIMSHIGDAEMPELVRDILDSNGYEEDVIHDILTIVLEIQYLAHGQDIEDMYNEA